MNLSEIFESLKRDKKGKKFWNTTRQLNAPERAPQVGEQLFGVRLPILNFKSYQEKWVHLLTKGFVMR